MSRTVWLVVPLLLIVPCGSQAAEKAKPECTEKMRGKLWPEKTSRGAGVPIEICAPKGWHYRWQQLTVDISQLKAGVKRKEELAVLPVSDSSPAEPRP